MAPGGRADTNGTATAEDEPSSGERRKAAAAASRFPAGSAAISQLVKLTGCCRFPVRPCRRTTGGSGIRPLSLSVRMSDGLGLFLFPCTLHTGTCRGATWHHWLSPANGKDPYHFLHTGTWKGASCDWPLPQRRSSEWRGVAPRSPKDGITFVIFDEGCRSVRLPAPPSRSRRYRYARRDPGDRRQLLVKCSFATSCPDSLQTGILQGVAGGRATSERR